MSSVFKSERKCSYDPTKDTELTGYEALAFAIVRQAVEDYKNAVADDNASKRTELLRFFDSPWCEMLTDLDMRFVARKLDQRVKDFMDLADRQPDMVRSDFERLSTRGNYGRFPPTPAFTCPICRNLVQTRWGMVSYTFVWDNNFTRRKVYHHGWVVRCTGCGITKKYSDKVLDQQFQERK